MDIDIKQLNKVLTNGLKSSYLELEFSGKSVRCIVNSLRRIALDDIPTYAFCEDTINIKTNTSIFDNDEMKLRIAQLPINNVNNDIKYLASEYWKDVNYANQPNEKKHPDDKINIEIYLNITNNDIKNINVTTNELNFFENDVEKTDKYDKKYPLLIIKLRPSETFTFSAKGVIGIGQKNKIWSAVRNCYFEKAKKNVYKFTIKSAGQFDEYVVLEKACDVILYKLDYFYNEFEKIGKKIKDKTELTMTLNEEDIALGDLITTYLRRNGIQAGCSKSSSKVSLCVDDIKICIIAKNANVIDIIVENITFLKKLFTGLKKKFEILEKKHSSNN